MPTESCYDAIGDPTVADAIMDCIIHTAQRIELNGESVRKMTAYRAKQTIIIRPTGQDFLRGQL